MTGEKVKVLSPQIYLYTYIEEEDIVVLRQIRTTPHGHGNVRVVSCFLKTIGVVCVDVSDTLLEEDILLKKFSVALEENDDQHYDSYLNQQGSGGEGMTDDELCST